MKKSAILSSVRFCILNRIFIPALCLLILGLVFRPYALCFTALSILAGLAILLASFYLIFPKFSHIGRKLSQYGDARMLMQDAEKELEETPVFPGNRLYLTPKYLIHLSPYFVYIIPLESVLWVFRENYMRFSFLAGKEKMFYRVRITTISGQIFRIRNRKKEELEQIMNVLIERYPNFFYGYSEEHDEMVHYILKENQEEKRAKNKR